MEHDHKAVLEAKQGTIESLQHMLAEARHEHAMFRCKILLQKVRTLCSELVVWPTGVWRVVCTACVHHDLSGAELSIRRVPTISS
jgi:hypothetical protein